MADRGATALNPLTCHVNGTRYFAIGPDFYALGHHYVYTAGDVALSFLALVLFALVMFAIALRTFSLDVVS